MVKDFKKILLVEPDFPYPSKSKNKANQVHKNFVPLGLLKLGAYYKSLGDKVHLVRGKKNKKEIGFIPDEVLITSLFTYWSSYVWQTIIFYRSIFPKAIIKLGGIYASLHKDTEKVKQLSKIYNVEIFSGLHPEAEKFYPDYSLIGDIEYHATHMMRGCIRKCPFCGVWKLEPIPIYKNKEDIISEIKSIGKNKVIFYDNNLLTHPYITEILNEFAVLKVNNKSVILESQSGFDGRILEKNPELAVQLKKARFQNVRIAWDNSLDDKDSIEKQIKILVKAGFKPKDMSIFILYDFDIPYEDSIKKIAYCKKWGVQITDCRYRPLDLDYDNYNPHLRKGQPEGSYYIHSVSGWTDKKVRLFRSEVRKHNIWIRYCKDKGLEYDSRIERWSAIHNLYKYFNLGRPPKNEEITRSDIYKSRIKNLYKLKKKNENNNSNRVDLSKYKIENIDSIIEKLLVEN